MRASSSRIEAHEEKGERMEKAEDCKQSSKDLLTTNNRYSDCAEEFGVWHA